jgi:hypothetical protein
MAPQTIQQQLDAFNPSTAGTYNPGQVVIFFDHRGFKTEKDTMGRFQNYWLSTKYRLGWPSIWYTNDLEPGKLRLIWYTVSIRFWSQTIVYKLLTHRSTPAPKEGVSILCTWHTQLRICMTTSPARVSGP